MLQIQKKLINYNFSKRTDKIKYIVIHTTGNTSKGAGVENHFKYFNGGNRGSSADYFVDDKTIGQFVNDYNYSWHCGDGKGKYGITNNNSIGVEICVNSDGDYNKTINNTIDLVKYLMKKYSISISNVVRHYDASRKNCPAEILSGKNGVTWTEFKNRLTKNNSVNNKEYNATVININSYLMVRSAPNSNIEIGKIYNNERVKVIETNGDYKKVKYDTSSGLLSKEGWVTGKYVKEDEVIKQEIQAPAENKNNVYRIYADGKQQGTAYANLENILSHVEIALKNNAALIEVKKK